VGDVFRANDAALPGIPHLGPAEAEELGMGKAGFEGNDKLRAVVVAACLSGGEKDSRV